MEPVFQAHPIPQNVTNFEFHLVGDMTLKQFGYLAAGLGFAFLVFTTLSTVQPIIAWPLIVISAILGVAFAFLPIQERPLDHWVAAFFKAIFKPTSLKYTSKIINPDDPLFNRRLSHYIKTYKYNEARKNAPLGNPNLLPQNFTSGTISPAVQKTPLTAQKKQSFIEKFKAGQTSFTPPTAQAPNARIQPIKPQPQAFPSTTLNSTLPITPSPSVPTPVKPQVAPSQAQKVPPLPSLQSSSPTPGILRNMEVISKLPSAGQMANPGASPQAPEQKPAEPLKSGDIKKTVELAHEAQETQQQIVKIENSLSQLKQQAAQPGVDPKSYIEDFQEMLTELQKLNEKASKTAQELAEVSKTTPQPLEPVEVIAKNAPPVKAKSIPTLKLTGFPNVINGIVTDSVGNYLEGAIVVAHDRQGLPVRALKSNKLGQFVAATPLPNGEYSITVEKDNLSFDKVGIELNNQVLPPILVAAKKLAATSS